MTTAAMTTVTSAWSARSAGHADVTVETIIVVGLVSLAMIGFFTGLKELAQDLRNLRKVKI